MSKLKNSLTEEQMDALGEVSEGLMSYEDFLKYYNPYDMATSDANSHDCDIETGDPNASCNHPIHEAQGE